MPKIDAPTVAEHHEQRRAALLEAAAGLLAEGGLDAVTLAAVGQAAGLARSSVYQYFDSAPALIAAVVEDVMPRAVQDLASRMDSVPSPAARVDTYVRTALAAATDQTHRALAVLATAPLPPACAARLAELHADQQAPLRAALTDLGVPDPELSAQLVAAVVHAAGRAVLAGQPLEHVLPRVLDLVHGGVGGTA